MRVTLEQLLRTTAWSEIRTALVQLAPEAAGSMNEYQRLHAQLGGLLAHVSSMRIVIQAVPVDDPAGSVTLDVTGSDGTVNRELQDFEYLGAAATEAYGAQEVTFSLCLRPRAEWLGMAVDQTTLATFTPAEIIACCFDEMTFHGFDESEIDAFAKDLERRLDEVKAMSAEERDQMLVPAEAMFAGLREKSSDRR